MNNEKRTTSNEQRVTQSIEILKFEAGSGEEPEEE